MNKSFISFLVVLIVTSTAISQKKKDILLTIDGEPIYAKEFKRVYNKNLNLVQDESQKSVDGYLDLFVDYKLKVKEAIAQDLDKNKEYIKEFSKYEEQLSRNYLYEDKVTEELAREAFERSKIEINAAHILIKASYDDSPQDTLAAYTKIKEARKKALTGTDFGALVKEYTEEPGAAERGGDLGYFSAFSMVYPFEEAAYTTAVGEISEIIRTSYGYHILTVKDKRKREPDVTVSHIMISDKAADARTFVPEERIKEIAALLKKGTSFESLAKQYSEDKNSAKNGGKLRKFGRGQLRSKAFENKAFSIKEVGEITEPFKSEFGWHIVRLEKIHKEEVSFEDQKEMLEKKVSEGDRSKVVVNAISQKIIDKYGLKTNNGYTTYFDALVTDSITMRKWDYDTNNPELDTVLFTIGGEQETTFRDFAEFLKQVQTRRRLSKQKATIISSSFDEFRTNELKRYFRYRLEKENEEYASIINEYRDGLLIFDVMKNNIWDVARKDTLGLKNYYENNKQNYVWKQRIAGAILSSDDKAMVASAASMIQSGKTVDEIKKALNKNKEVNIIISEGIFEINEAVLPNGYKPSIGNSKIFEQNDSFIIVYAKDILKTATKLFEDVKGKVMSEYQAKVEKDWMSSLRKKYTVDINAKTLKRIKKELNK